MEFRSKESYRKWRAYGHMRTPSGARADHGKSAFEAKRGHQKVTIRGKVHKVKHRRQ